MDQIIEVQQVEEEVTEIVELPVEALFQVGGGLLGTQL
jgi:hypothetical protein